MAWNFGDILDTIEPVVAPDSLAFIHGDRRVTWREASFLSNNLARGLIERGARPRDKIALYMRNRPEYLLTLSASFKSRMTHVNINYRYTPDEVWYIFDNSDAQTVVYSSEFRDTITQIRPRLPSVKTWIEVSSDGEIAPFAEAFDAVAGTGDGSALGIERSGEDQLFIYTGGTTGMPKGVMWNHHDMREITLQNERKLGPVPETLEALRNHIRANPPMGRILPAPPLMHGTGLLTAMGTHLAGGCVITLTADSFDPHEMLQAIHDHRPLSLVIVGDSFGRPLVNALTASPGKYDLSSVVGIVSSGVMWSLEIKRAMLDHMPAAVLSDGFSSSEAIGMGSSLMTRDGEVQTAKFMLGDRCRVFDEHDQPVLPGSGVRGLVCLGPPNPVGYYKDEEKTARTFRVIDGVRYSIPGDWCTVEADGTLTLLGRGNACINTAGEKVFPEEVEEALKTHPSVEDALVIGLPDEKWGQSVNAVVQLIEGAQLDESDVKAHVRRSLAGYKTPKHIIVADRPMRASNGKADYGAAKACAAEQLQTA
jgi:acyl-CoA synthetase (AMP-forming)/AMP-acid ligase II